MLLSDHLPRIGQPGAPATPPPVIGQPMMIDSSQATPTIPLQCGRPKQRRRAARSRSSHSNASHGAAYRYKRPMSVSNRVWRNRRNRIWRNHVE